MIATLTRPDFIFGSGITLLSVALALAIIGGRSRVRASATLLALVLVEDVAYEVICLFAPGAIYSSRLIAVLFIAFCAVVAVALCIAFLIPLPEHHARVVQRGILCAVAVVFFLELLRPISILMTGGVTPSFRSFLFLLATFELLVCAVALALVLRIRRSTSHVTPGTVPAGA